MGGLSFASRPRPPLPFQRLRRRNLGQLRPARLPACGAVQAAPFGHSRRLALVPGHDVDLVDFHLAFERHLWRLGDQAAAQVLRHGLHVRPANAQFACDLPVGKVQPHEVEAQNPHAQPLVVPGQHGAGEIVEAGCTGFAPMPLPSRLRAVAPVPDHRRAAAPGALHALRPVVLAHKGEALGIVHQAGKVDQVRCSHERQSSSNENGRLIIPPFLSHQKLVGTTSHSHACQHPGTQQESCPFRCARSAVSGQQM